LCQVLGEGLGVGFETEEQAEAFGFGFVVYFEDGEGGCLVGWDREELSFRWFVVWLGLGCKVWKDQLYLIR